MPRDMDDEGVWEAGVPGVWEVRVWASGSAGHGVALVFIPQSAELSDQSRSLVGTK